MPVRERGSAPLAPAGRVTMKDIAARLDVSVNTVHKAIANKPGVSDEVRARILSCADELGYRRNASASSLRRKNVRVAVCLPSGEREGRYFSAYLWRGARRYAQQAQDAGISFEYIDYELGHSCRYLEDLLRRVHEGDGVDGLLALAPTDARETSLLRELAEAGVTVELVNGDAPHTKRFGAVVADYATAGHLMAEQASNLLHGTGGDARVLLLSGDGQTESHYLIARAFNEYLRAQRSSLVVGELAGGHAELDRMHRELAGCLQGTPPQLVCSVFAAGSELVADTLVELDLVGNVLAIGSDLFDESILALRRGIFTNLVYKDPVGMAFSAMRDLCEYLLWGTKAASDVRSGGVELVFRSNLDQYAEGAEHSL